MKEENVLNKYMESNILTATPEKLILMLYNGCIKNIHLAKKSIEENDIVNKNNFILKAESIVFELQASLDFNYPISKEINSLYEFIIDLLIDANINKDSSKLDAALKLVLEFRDTWEQAMKINQANVKTTKAG
ncbi:MAG: flagellar export chaperone FliS [Clostridia bacterium]|nr:flagellar export chaperone FliS [Clostridia bacterium]